MEYLLHVCVLFLLFALLASSLDLVCGRLGVLTVGHAAFFGLGAYASAIWTTEVGGSALQGWLIGMVIAGLASFAVSLPSLRLHGDYLLIATFAFQVIVHELFKNWMSLTGGLLGIPGVRRVEFLWFRIDSRIEFVCLGGFLLVFQTLFIRHFLGSPFGRVVTAIREDERLAQAFGKATLHYKFTMFAVSAALAASAGSFYAHYVTFVDPSSFSITQSILILSMVIIGGAGTLSGPLIGALLLVLIPEALRFVGVSVNGAANLREILYGLALVCVTVLRPGGLRVGYSFKSR